MTNYEAEKAEYEAPANIPEAKAIVGWKPLKATPIAPPFPVDTLPVPLAEISRAIAQNQSVPVDLPAVTGLAVLAACACGRVTVHIRKGWDEPCNLFLMPIIRSGGGKTPTFNAMGQLLFDWQGEQNRQRTAAISADAAELEVLQSIKAEAVKQKDINRARSAGERISNFHPTKQVKRFISGNTTPEQLISIMADNEDGAVSMLDDDGGQLLDMLAGQYQARPNLEPYLKGFNGTAIISERRSGSVTVDHAYLTALIMLQPSAFQDMLADPRNVGRGFLARFLFCFPEPLFDIGDEPDVTERVKLAYQEALNSLLDMPKARYLLTEEARRYFMDWRREVTQRCSAEWAVLFAYNIPQKLISNAARLSGLLKLMEEPNAEEPVTAAIMRDAISIAEYFAAHMLRAFETEAAISPPAREALRLIQENGEALQREREIKQALGKRKLFAPAGTAEAALCELEKGGFIRRTQANGGGRPVMWVELHPDLLAQTEVEEI